MAGGRSIGELLESAPTRAMARRLYRVVPALSFLRSAAPTFLYKSGRAGRCNPAGVDCLYFSETEETALHEYRYGVTGTKAENAPRLTFVAEVDFRHVLDLSKRETLRALDLDDADLRASWRLARTPTVLQRLGEALSRQARISALRLPSLRSSTSGRQGWNVAIFPMSIADPDRLKVVGENGGTLEELP